MPKTAEPRYTEAEFDAMYGPRLERLAEQMVEMQASLRELIEKLEEEARAAEAGDADA